ncbi:tetratricopeptide repeat protein [Uliginosibacterium sp. H3]|uniref:Tetratricopeptide repeat protein n=1 Tax=Uliginosibacterium silvisoli TaxID=3114758 RepID=A0ABU6K516_9RHOO|nr:tetratricopeptide repeat protein [Uliginosibacterium sp. H3]
MSLLIDALKQAEAARAQAQGNETPPTGGIELEPLPEPRLSTPPPVASNAREASTPTPVRSASHARPTPAVSSTAASQAARELFEVKQQGPNRMPLILAGVGIALLLIGAGYVWWAIQPRSSLIAPNVQATPQAVAQMPVITEPAQAVPPAEVVSAVPDASVATNSPVTTPEPPSSIPLPHREGRTPVRASASPKPPVDATLQDEVKPSPRTSAPPDNGIQSAYAAFQEGNYAVARQRYQEVLRLDPRNVDALNALGLIAWRSGQPDVAERMFRTAAQTDPKDITANAQLALLYAEGDPTAAESRLRNLIASQPAGVAAHYSLGSLLARQGRWNEAQQALFQAYTLDSDNPDILFNLAISLEHLSQPGVARQFYERALQATARRPAGFDKSVAQSRIQALRER